jgi:hypothetical protein
MSILVCWDGDLSNFLPGVFSNLTGTLDPHTHAGHLYHALVLFQLAIYLSNGQTISTYLNQIKYKIKIQQAELMLEETEMIQEVKL